MGLVGNEWGPADFAAVNGNNGYGNNDGFGGGALYLLLVLFFFAMMFGGGFGWGGGFGMGAGNGGGGVTYVDNAVQRGFDQQAVMGGINGITSGINGIQQAICGVNQNMMNGFSQAEIAENARQMGYMNQMFGLQGQLTEGLFENRLASERLANVVQTENCADRQVVSDGFRDLQTYIDGKFQRLSDQQYEARIADLERQLNRADNIAARSNDRDAIINGVYNRLNECPVGTTPVYGEQPIFTCRGNNGGCGCGCGNGFNGF